jgi:hypothetical protein
MWGARRTTLILLLALTVVGLGRVAMTWHVYTPTYDEPSHLAAGMEWLDRGVYRYEAMHTPLARVAAALGPYLDGYHSQGLPDIKAEGLSILAQRGEPGRAIALARAGELPFLLLAILIVFAWTRSLAGDAAGLLAVLAFTSVPPVLAHSGLATTDAAAMATVGAALFALTRFLERPTPATTLVLGIAVGLALLAKLSALVFLPVAGGLVLAAWLVTGNRVPSFARLSASVGLVAFLIVWAGYRFSVAPIWPHAASHASGPITVLKDIPYPAPEFARGMIQLRKSNAKGRRSYLLGKPAMGGRWYFFPVALGVKTPIPFLLLAAVGIAALLRKARQRPLAAAPPLAAAIVLGMAMPANLNIGVRHILPLYPMLAVCAGIGGEAIWRWPRARVAGPLLAGGLTLWLIAESVIAHPDYLPYFNELAGRHPEEILVDSDLDWGQDLGRMVDTVRARQVDHLWITYHGTADLSRRGLPPFTILKPDTEVTGWVAASVYSIQLGEHGGGFSGFAWLRRYKPIARAGHSMRLYYIEPPNRSGVPDLQTR